MLYSIDAKSLIVAYASFSFLCFGLHYLAVILLAKSMLSVKPFTQCI